MNVPTSSLEDSHFPVMLEEVINTCRPEEGGNFLDCTFGGGGYTEAILNFPNTHVTSFDRDKFVINIANNLKKKYPDRFKFYHEKFSNLDKVISKKNNIDYIIFDLGISSFQLMDLSRGFSFKSKDKIDMKMGLSAISAEDVINNYEESKLKLILKIFGEEKEASRIAKNISIARKNKKIETVNQLVEIVERSKKKNFQKKINVCTKTFQALRIFVNKETTELIKGIIKAAKVIKPGGKIVVISFHSIEDKIVKFFFSNYSSNKSKPSRYLPEDKNNQNILFEDYDNSLMRPSENELKKNPASRSAKLRYALRNQNDFQNPIELELKFKKYLELEASND